METKVEVSFKEIVFSRKKKKERKTKDINSLYTREEMQKANNHMKKYSSSVIMKDINKNNNQE